MRSFLALSVLLPAFSFAQSVFVFDAQSGDPISQVYIYCAKNSAATDQNGRADLKGFKACERISFQHPGYQDTAVLRQNIRAANFRLAMRPTIFGLEEVQLNYNRWEENERQIPIQIAQIEKKEIAFQNPQTTADLLGGTNGVYIQKSQLGGGSPMLRGFSTSRILLVVDGVRMNTAIFRQGNVQNVISLDANAMQSAEVIFGPGSVIYGSDAIGGVIDFHTTDPNYAGNENFDFGLNYLARTASANFEKTGHLDFTLSGKKIASFTSFTYSDFDDLRMGRHGPDDYLRAVYQETVDGQDEIIQNPDPLVQRFSGYNQMNLTQKLRFRVGKKSELMYGFHYSTTSDVPRYDRLTVESDVTILENAEWYYGPQEWIMHHLRFQSNRATKLFDRVKIGAAYQFFEESRHDRRFGRATLRHRTENVDAISATLDFDKKMDLKNTLFYGAEFVHNKVGSFGESENIETGETANIPTRYPNGSTWQSTAAYLNWRHQFSEKLTLNVGGRGNFIALRGTLDRDEYDFPFDNIDNNYQAANGSVGISWLPQDDLQIRANISNGFRAPNVDDAAKIFDSGNGIVVVPNPDLKPEYLYTADLGFVKNVGRNVQFEASAFYSVLQNAFVREPFSFNGNDSIIYDDELSQVQALQNVECATVYGFQTALKITLIENLFLKSTLQFTDGETEEGEPVRHVAPLFGEARLGYEKAKWKLALFSIFNGEMDAEDLAFSERDKENLYAKDENGQPFSPAWAILNFKAEYQFCDPLTVQIGVENIFDKRYRPYSSGISAAGRNFTVAVRGRF